MGAWRRLGEAAALAAILSAGTRAGASTVMEPIARLSLEGGYDTNALYDGAGGDRMGRVSPELGLRLRDPLWELRATAGGDFIYYQRLAPGGIWNQRGALTLHGRPTRRTVLDGSLRASWAYDPVGLAQAGVFRPGQQSAFLLGMRMRGDWKALRRLGLAATWTERAVIFEDRTGGAMHAPGLEGMWAETERLSVGSSYAFGLFQDFDPGHRGTSTSHGLRARARYRLTRHLTLDVGAGPALYLGSKTSVVPEATVELLGASRGWDLRLTAAHGLALGMTALPGLVDSFEFGGDRVWRRRWYVHSDGGLWRSGSAPSGADAVTGYAVAGEGGTFLRENLRLGLGFTRFARLDDASPAYRRTTFGLRLGWEMRAR
jgi:hypothetical protein